MSYQWQQLSGVTWVNLTDAGRISGATTSTLTITGTVTTDDAIFRCWMNNGYELDTYTNPVTLLVRPVEKKDGSSNSPDDVAGMPGSGACTAGSSSEGEDTDVTQGTSSSEDVLRGVNIQSTDVVLLDEQSGNSNVDAVDNSQGANLGRAILASQSWVGMNCPGAQ